MFRFNLYDLIQSERGHQQLIHDDHAASQQGPLSQYDFDYFLNTGDPSAWTDPTSISLGGPLEKKIIVSRETPCILLQAFLQAGFSLYALVHNKGQTQLIPFSVDSSIVESPDLTKLQAERTMKLVNSIIDKEEDILNELIKPHLQINPAHYRVADHFFCQQLLSRHAKDKRYAFYINATDLKHPEYIERLQQVVRLDKVEHIMVRNFDRKVDVSDRLAELLALPMPLLQQLTLSEWYQPDVSFLKKSRIPILMIRNYQCDQFPEVQALKFLKKLTVGSYTNQNVLKKVELPDEICEFEVRGLIVFSESLDLSHYHQLEKISAEGYACPILPPNIKTFNFEMLSDSIDITMPPPALPLADYKKLKHIEFTHPFQSYNLPKDILSLTVMTLDDGELDLTPYQKLEDLKITTVLATLPKIESLKSLKKVNLVIPYVIDETELCFPEGIQSIELDLTVTESMTFDFSKYPHLKRLKLLFRSKEKDQNIFNILVPKGIETLIMWRDEKSLNGSKPPDSVFRIQYFQKAQEHTAFKTLKLENVIIENEPLKLPPNIKKIILKGRSKETKIDWAQYSHLQRVVRDVKAKDNEYLIQNGLYVYDANKDIFLDQYFFCYPAFYFYPKKIPQQSNQRTKQRLSSVTSSRPLTALSRPAPIYAYFQSEVPCIIRYKIYEKSLDGSLAVVPPNTYIETIQESINFNGVFCIQSNRTLSKKFPYEITERTQYHLDDIKLGQFITQFPLTQRNVWMALPGTHIKEQIFSIVRPKETELAYDPQFNRVYILYTGFDLKANVQYVFGAMERSLVLNQTAPFVLSGDAKKEFDQFIISEKKDHSGEFKTIQKKIKDYQKKPLPQKIEFCRTELADYFRKFKDKTCTDTEEKDGFKSATVTQCGACTERSKSFIICCQGLGVSAVHNENSIHGFPFVFDGKDWVPCQLGGAAGGLKDISSPLRVQGLASDSNETKKKPMPPSEEKEGVLSSSLKEKEDQSPRSEEKPSLSPSSTIAETKTTVPQALNIVECLCAPTDERKNFIVKLNNEKEITALHRELYAETCKLGKDYFYIGASEDITAHWQWIKTEGGKSVKVAGPLQQLVLQGGTLVVNADHLSPKKMMAIKSIMDTIPNLSGLGKVTCRDEDDKVPHPVSKDLRIITLYTEKATLPKPFFSRSDYCPWPDETPRPVLSVPLLPSTEDEKKQNVLEINLSGKENTWSQYLLGRIQPSRTGHQFKVGHLQQQKAFETYTGVRFLVPHTMPSAFQAWLERLQTERWCVINGERIEVPQGFTIERGPYVPYVRPACLVSVEESALDFKKNAVFYLHPKNIESIAREKQVIVNEQMEPLTNWLATKDGRQKQLVVTAPLSPEEEQTLFSLLPQDKDAEKIHRLDLPERVKQETKSSPDWASRLKAPGGHIIDDAGDPDFVIEMLKKELKEDDVPVVSIHMQTQYADLIEHTQFQKSTEEKIFFTHTIKAVAKALIEGKTIILKGKLTKDFYHAIETIFSKEPELKLASNATPQSVKGKVIVVSSPLDFEPRLANSAHRIHSIDPNELWTDYENQLKIDFPEYEAKHLEEIKAFINGAKKNNISLRFSYGPVLNCLTAFHEKRGLAAIKHFFIAHYPKESEAHALLTKQCEAMWGALPEEKYCYQEDMQNVLEQYNGVILQGKTGSGKTYLGIQQDKKHRPFWGNDKKSLIDFLNSKPTKDNPSILVVDEANYNSPYGYWDFLKPLFSVNQKRYRSGQYDVRFDNQSFSLSKYHKVIFTCNPPHYEGRFELGLNCPVVPVDHWSPENLLNVICKPLCGSVLFPKEILDVYLRLQNQFPADTISVRHLTHVTRRFLAHLQFAKTPNEAAYLACLDEWGRHFGRSQRQSFRETLSTTFKIGEVALTERDECLLKKLPADYYCSSERAQQLIEMHHDVQLAAERDKSSFNAIDGSPSAKLGVLMVGPSGIGKSEMARALASAMDLKECSPEMLVDDRITDLSQHFFQFTLNEDMDLNVQWIQAALRKGCKLILDEANLYADHVVQFQSKEETVPYKITFNAYLGHILTGKDERGRPLTSPIHKDFFLFASQNPIADGCTLSADKSLFNRLHVYHMEEDTRNDLIEMARRAHPTLARPQIEMVVDHYLHERALHPQYMNTRMFFKKLKSIEVPRPVPIEVVLPTLSETVDPQAITTATQSNEQSIVQSLTQQLSSMDQEALMAFCRYRNVGATLCILGGIAVIATAILVAIGTFGILSAPALAGIIGGVSLVGTGIGLFRHAQNCKNENHLPPLHHSLCANNG